MNTQELKEAIEKSNLETEAKAELIEILERLDFEKARHLHPEPLRRWR